MAIKRSEAQIKKILLEQEARMKEIFDPAQAALLIVDLQNDFLSPDGIIAQEGGNIEPMRAILPAIKKVTDLFYKLNLPVIRTITYEDLELRTNAGRDRYYFSTDGGLGERTVCTKGSKGAELYIPAQKGDIIVEKDRVSAYIGGKLHKIISDLKIKTIFVVGVKTQRCVKRTAEDLYENEKDLHVVLLEDCVASDNPKQHKAVIDEFREFYPPVMKSTELIEKWN